MRILKKILHILATIILAIGVISLVSYGVCSIQENAIHKKLFNQQSISSFTKEQAVSELNAYQNLLEETHPNPYHTTGRADFNALKEKLVAGMGDNVSRTELYVSLSELSNSLMDEHVYVDFPKDMKNTLSANGTLVCPLLVSIGDKAITVKEDLSGTVPSCAEIISINQISAEKIIKSMSVLKSGRNSEQILDYAGDSFAELLYCLYGQQNSYQISYKRDGQTLTADVPGISYKEYLQKTALCNQYKISEDGKTAYFQFDSFMDTDGQNLSNTIDSLFAEMKAKGTENLFFDISRNQGGSSSYGDEILEYLANKPFEQMTHSTFKVSEMGRKDIMTYIPKYLRWMQLQYLLPTLRPLYVQDMGSTFDVNFSPISPKPESKRYTGGVTLRIGERTMSSACLFAGTFKDLKLGSIEGSPTGGYPEHYGNVVDVTLPLSGMTVQMPTSINYGIGGSQPVTPGT